MQEKEWDDFTKLRKKLAKDLKQIREEIQQRNELVGKDEFNKTATTVKRSQEIRNKLKEVGKEIDSLEKLQQREAEKLEERKIKKKDIPVEEEQEIERRAEIVLLCRSHVDECRRLEKTTKSNTTVMLFDRDNNSTDPLISELPDIDGDEGFQMIKENDRQIDKKLDIVHGMIGELKEGAMLMGQEVERQGQMMEELEESVEKATANLVNLNKRLKDTIQKVRRADRFCIDIILVIVILGIGAYLYNVFTNGGF